MDKWSVGFCGGVFPKSTAALGSVEQVVQDPRVALIAPPIAVQIVHLSVVVFIDEDVGRRAERVTAVEDVPDRVIVRWRAIATHDVKRRGGVPRGVHKGEQ